MSCLSHLKENPARKNHNRANFILNHRYVGEGGGEESDEIAYRWNYTVSFLSLGVLVLFFFVLFYIHKDRIEI
jgi:hypothetical protein